MGIKIKPLDLLALPLTSAASFIKGLEGFIPKSKWDVRQWTWGYGTKAPAGGLTITQAAAQRELENYLKADAAKIAKDLKVPITSNAFTALLSFGYNLGYGRAKLLIDDLNKGLPLQSVATRMKQYIYADGVPLAGLKTRREKEAAKLLS